MAGGAWEYMANSIEEGTSYVTELRKYLPNFATIYKGNSDDGKIPGTQTDDGLGRFANYKTNKEMYGDTVWETSNVSSEGTNNPEKYFYYNAWNSDSSYFPIYSQPIFIRSGSFYGGYHVGIFLFYSDYGNIYNAYGFRVVAL